MWETSSKTKHDVLENIQSWMKAQDAAGDSQIDPTGLLMTRIQEIQLGCEVTTPDDDCMQEDSTETQLFND